MVFVNTLASSGKIMKFNKEKNCFACLANNKSNNSHTEPKAKKERERLEAAILLTLGWSIEL